uniref:VPS10 domain-containing protein n=1 Tax=Vannella robusta TaxID=1487602 RepID=A0A7S4I8T8_9EUKA|mmetsp:Transcript_22097/g.28220  ORF Transcript_22097/g.28220 Transcript_22097/m.28220 type:complete len:765 (+) Transcript_22097:3-2297(+)
MRGAPQVSFFVLLLFVSFSLQLECEDFQIASEKRKVDGRVVQILFADSENTQIYVLTSKNSVYKSSDGGESWKKQMSYMSHSDDKQPGYDEAGVQKMFKSPIDGHVLFMGFGYQYWTTDGNDQSYDYYHDKDSAWKEFIPSTQQGDAILGIKYSGSCLVYESCYKSLYYSEDWGANWILLRSYIYKASWADNGSIYTISVPNELQSGTQDAIPKASRVLYRINSQAEVLYESAPGFFDFDNSNGVIYAVNQVNGTLQMSISTDRAASFIPAKFFDSVSDYPQDVSQYTLIDNSDGVTYLHVNRANSINYGTIYEANTNECEFWPSLRSNRVSPGTHIIDFQPILGQNGIFIANQYNISLLMGDSPVNEQYVTSVISRNKGGSWSPLPVPANSLCSSPSCSLHLSGPVDGAEILTSREIPGLLLASGNEGTVRLTRDDNVNLYLSRNSGVTWERVQEGPRVFNWGNYGSLFVSTTAASETSSVEFSWDQGKSWDSCEYYSEPMEVEGIVPIGADSLEFLVYGSTDIDGDLDGYVFYLNFSENMTSVCTGQNAPGDIASDFEAWSTMWEDDCLLGESTTYTRRRRESVCLVTSPPFAVSSATCECSRDDYICDTPCYTPEMGENGEIDCVLRDECKSMEDEYECDEETVTSKGYQLIQGDTCKGGLNLAATQQNCTSSTVTTYSAFAVDFLSYVMLAVFIGLSIFSLVVLLILFLYKTNDSVHQKLSPLIPDWCTREPGAVDEDEDKLYSQLDDSSSHSLIDDMFE